LIFEYFSKKYVKNISFDSNQTSRTGTLHEDQYTFLIVSRSVLLRMGNVSDKICGSNQNTYSMLNKVYSLENGAIYKVM
jgi:hypothetical protein